MTVYPLVPNDKKGKIVIDETKEPFDVWNEVPRVPDYEWYYNMTTLGI